MSDLLAVVTRNRDDIEDVGEYVAREQRAAGRTRRRPRQAGVDASARRPRGRRRVRAEGLAGVSRCAALGSVTVTSSVSRPPRSTRRATSVTNAPARADSDSQPLMCSGVTSAVSPGPRCTGVTSVGWKRRDGG